jgi:hypothetical protein
VWPASRRNKSGELVENKSPQNGLQVDGTEERGENENLRQKNDARLCSAVITEDRQQLWRFPSEKGRATKQHNTSKRRFLPQLKSKTKIRQWHQRPNKIEVRKRPGVAQGSPERNQHHRQKKNHGLGLGTGAHTQQEHRKALQRLRPMQISESSKTDQHGTEHNHSDERTKRKRT